jgi:hypothetical protein
VFYQQRLQAIAEQQGKLAEGTSTVQ